VVAVDGSGNAREAVYDFKYSDLKLAIIVIVVFVLLLLVVFRFLVKKRKNDSIQK